MIEPKESLRNLFRPPVLQEGRYEKLRLDKNENTTGFPKRVVREMLSHISPHFLAAYPEPYSLYQRLAKWHQVQVDNILVTSGSEMAIRYLFECFLEKGDEIIILNPSFAMFEVYAKICRARVVLIDYDQDLHVSPGRILEGISRRTKIIAIANPDNPTGTAIASDELIRIIKRAARYGAVVLVDEAYFHFYKETMLPWCKDFCNLVVTRTFSKACGLAGVRLGYAVADANLIAEVRKLQPIDHVNSFAVKLGEYLIDHEDLIWACVKQVEEAKEYLLRGLARLGLPGRGGFGNFVLVDLSQRKEEVVESLRARDVLVGSNLRLPHGSSYIRVTVGTVSQMRRLLAALTEVVDGSAERRGTARHRRRGESGPCNQVWRV